ncbi:LOW QUALITY PROTEIN: gamma-secretase subunit Aph-1 [Drosophila eugracilis]|uniref:LOW QUALITY PROTEIN: gamma-secretase subunit Aph-1 n=1 Tax=Drosophila eugracilis TaxID=29029 RepID=UPI0007E8760F|nr:LOW QUALITY PROTEIN: gamma-secretase subunit Aph-1 [Drosophila eugracilis]
MTLPEFFGCTFIAFGPPFALFVFTIANDPVRIIILIAAAFFWLLSLLISSLWYALIPLKDFIAFGVVFSVLFQEGFRYIIYRILRSTEQGLHAVAEDTRVTDNKHILAYVSGLGFGIISGMFALVNVLADMSGPGTMGLKSGTELFFVTSAAQALSIILLHTFWSVIFFNAFDTNNYIHIGYVVGSHLFVSLITLLNANELYTTTLLINYLVTIVTGVLAFRVAGGTSRSFKKFITCQ